MSVASFIPKVWAASLMTEFHAAQVVIPTVNREYEGTASKGNKVTINQAATPTIGDYKADSSTDPLGGASHRIGIEEVGTTAQDLLIDQEKYTAFRVDDVDRTQAAGSLQPFTTESGEALAEDSESYVCAQMLAGGTALTSTALSDFASAYKVVNNIRLALGNAKVPSTNRYLAVNPDFASFLLGPGSTLTQVNTAGSSQELRRGVIGSLLGFTVLETPMLGAAGTATAVGYYSRAVAYVNQLQETKSQELVDAFGDLVKSLHVYGAKVTRPKAVQTFQASAA